MFIAPVRSGGSSGRVSPEASNPSHALSEAIVSVNNCPVTPETSTSSIDALVDNVSDRSNCEFSSNIIGLEVPENNSEATKNIREGTFYYIEERRNKGDYKGLKGKPRIRITRIELLVQGVRVFCNDVQTCKYDDYNKHNKKSKRFSTRVEIIVTKVDEEISVNVFKIEARRYLYLKYFSPLDDVD